LFETFVAPLCHPGQRAEGVAVILKQVGKERKT